MPVAPEETLIAMSALVDEVVCLETPDPFHSIGQHYGDFHQLEDGEVLAILERFR